MYRKWKLEVAVSSIKIHFKMGLLILLLGLGTDERAFAVSYFCKGPLSVVYAGLFPDEYYLKQAIGEQDAAEAELNQKVADARIRSVGVIPPSHSTGPAVPSRSARLPAVSEVHWPG